MRFVGVRDLRSRSAELWWDLPAEGQMVVTSNGKPVAILAAVDETTVEESAAAIRRARAVQAVQSIELASVASGLDRMTMEEIDEEIQAARRARRSG
jgi:antitoxin (DNA-binding transcriptional repressor) of toxin-antitoxin stability system